jgi:fructokinase
MTVRTVVIGEALIDIVRDPYGNVEEHVGGSPLNVAAGIARLGHPVDFATTLGHDPHGERIEQLLAERGVHLLPTSRTSDPTSTALADLDESGAASYTFDLHWNLPEVPLADDTGHVHTGSIGAMLDPGGANVLAALRAIRDRGTVSYDPNVRPTIMGPVEQIRPRMEEIIGLSDVAKASNDDMDILYAGQSAAEVLSRWCDLGVGMAVVTLGPHGVVYRVRGSDAIGELPTRALRVVDTVGAGDSFMAGLVSGLLSAGFLGDPGARERLAGATLDDVRPAVERALACAGITVGHAGAYAPAMDEL